MRVSKIFRRVVIVEDFNRLVNEQLKTMDKLLFLQSELERCQHIEEQLKQIQQETQLESVQVEIAKMKAELKEIHHIFERQTEEVIRSYQGVNVPV
jgi:hypothetical protein